MSTDSTPTPQPPVPAAPPTQPGTRGTRKGPLAWPVVLGTAAIVIGIGGMIAAAMGLLMPKFGSTISAAGAAGQPMVGYFGELPSSFIIYYWCTLALALMLSIAGYRMLVTRPSAPAWMVIWAILKLIHAVFAVYFTLEYATMGMEGQQSMWISSSPNPPPATVVATLNTIMTWFTGVFTAVWSIWAPILVLWWFHRSKVRAEWVARCAAVPRRAA